MGATECAAHDGLRRGELIATGEIHAGELAAPPIESIEQVDDPLNAVLETFHDRVAALDGDPPPAGPFRGVPLFRRDLGSGIVGRLQEVGVPPFRGHRDVDEHRLTRNFLDAGLHILGRTAAVPPLAAAVDTTSPPHGITRNP